jgi:hypothetical protein
MKFTQTERVKLRTKPHNRVMVRIEGNVSWDYVKGRRLSLGLTSGRSYRKTTVGSKPSCSAYFEYEELNFTFDTTKSIFSV